MSEFTQGDVARLSLTVADIDGAAVAPSALALMLQLPSGAQTAATVTAEGVGQYYSDVEFDEPGVYIYRWESTGTYKGAVEGEIFVIKTRLGL